MNSAMEQLASELRKLPADEWARLPEPRIDASDSGAAPGPVPDAGIKDAQLSQHELTQGTVADHQEQNKSTPSSESHREIAPRGAP